MVFLASIKRRKRLWGYFLILVAALTTVTSLRAQSACRVRSFNIRDGLAANFISSLCQTSDGLVWVSTWNGLNCYDGYQFTTFRSQPGKGDVLTTNRIIRIEANTMDNVWCITFDRNLYLFDTHECRFADCGELVRQKYGVSIPARNIYTFKSGVTWVTCDREMKALLRIDDSRPLDTAAVQLIKFDKLGLHVNYIHKVVEDRDHREWILTDKGVVYWGGGLRIPQHYEYVEQIGERVYMASPDGRIGYWQPGARQLTAVRLTPAPTRISAMVATGTGRSLLMATDRGVIAIGADGRATTLSHTPATDIFTDSRQRIWAFGADRTVELVHSTSGRLQGKNHDGTSRCQLHLPSVANYSYLNTLTLSGRTSHPLWVEDRQGTVWMACDGSPLCYFDETRGEILAYELSQGASNTLIDKYMVDSQRNVWFSSTHDLSLLTFRHSGLRFVEMSKGQETRALCFDRQGRLWAGTADGYLRAFAPDGSAIGWLSPAGTLQQQPVKFATKIYAVFCDSKDRLWVGTKGQGLYCCESMVDGKKFQVSGFRFQEDDKGSLSNDEVYAIDEDVYHQLWVGTYGGGVNLVQETGTESAQPHKFFFINSNNTLQGYDLERYGRIRRVTHDGKGRMLLSTTGGLVVFHNRRRELNETRFRGFTHEKGDTTSLLTVDVMQTCVTKQGKLLVATMGGGMQEVSGGTNRLDSDIVFSRMTQFTPDEGNVIAMVEDKMGQVWVVRETTLNRYAPQTGEVVTVSREKTEFSEAQPTCDPITGRIAVGAMGGVVLFDPRQIHQSDDCPPIVFTSVRYHGEQTSHPLLNTSTLHVAHNRRNLTVSFAALAYGDNEGISYAYQLVTDKASLSVNVGAGPVSASQPDREWTYVGTSHQAQLNRLPPGRHRLTVRSTNSDGKWQDNVATLIIEAEPTFWESWRGVLVKVLAALAAVYAALHIWRLRQQIKLERQMNTMKSKFYDDVTQELREPLTQIGDIVADDINSRVHLPQRLEQVEVKAQHMLAIVDQKINEYKLAPMKIVDEDKRMMDQLMDFLDHNIGNSELKIEDMAAAVNLGRSVFFGKMRAMTGMAPVDFLRDMRIKRAGELLLRSHYPVSQIAYQVGFTDPKYFTKCFKKVMGLTPSEYRAKEKTPLT